MIDHSLSQAIRAEVDTAQRILLHFHPTADGDSVGSALGLRAALVNLGKEVTVIQGDTAFPEYLRHLPGAETVEAQAYPDVETTEFDLFIILDSASKTQISNREEVIFPENLRTVVIDHHATNDGYGDVNWIDSGYPATCQMVYELLLSWDIDFTHDMAACLFVGMFTDTGGFQYPPTSGDTFRAAADLVDRVPDFSQYIFHIENSYTPEHLYYRGLALNNIHLYHGEKIAISLVSYTDLQSRGIQPDQADKSFIANQLKSVVGWDVAVGMVETEPGTVKVSFRTRRPDVYHVGKIAALLGGGGHQAAAGASLRNVSLEDAQRQVVQAVLAWENEHSNT